MSSSDEEALYDDLDDYRVLIDPHGSENDDAINNNDDDDDDDDDDNDDDDGFNYIDDFEGMDPDEIDLLAEFSDINSDEQSNPDGKRKKKEKKKKMKESGKYNDNFKYSESEQESTDGEDEEQNFMNAIREANNFKVKTKKKSGGTGYRRVKTVDPEIAMLLSEANEAYVRNDIQVAENLYNEVIKKDAKNFAAYKTLGDIYQIQGRLNDCCNSWFLAAHLNSSDWEFWKVVGSLSNELNHKRQALYCYSRALSVNPNDAQCIYERALLYKTIGQLGRALESFQKLHKIYPYDGDILRELAVTYVDYDKIDEAIELYLKILKQNIEKRKIIRNYMENALDSSSEDEDTDSAEETDNEYDDSEDQEFNELPKKLRNKYRCIPFDWSSLNILAELYLKWAPTDPLHAIRNIKRCARWIQYRESQTFWDDVSNDSEFDERRQKNAKFQALGDFKNDFEYFLPIDIRIRLGLLRLASKNIPEGLVHFNFLFVENFEDIADLFFEVGVALTKLEEYKHAVDFFEPLWDFPGYSTLEYYKPLAKCYRELEKYEEAKNVYSKIVEMRPGDLESKLTLAEMYYHLANLNMFNKLLLEVVQARKRQKEQDGENEKKDNNEVGSDVVDNNNLPIGDVSSTAKPLMTDDKPLFNAINAKKKKKLKGVDMEKYRKEREQKIAASVIDRYKKLKIYKLGMNKNDENQLMLWIDTASDLVDIFTSVRNFFVKNRSKKFVGIIKRARKFNKLLDYKIERLSKLSMGENLIDGMPITEERIQLISTTELRGLKYDEWFELFMELALIVTKYQSIEDGLSIIETAQDINVFHQDPNRNKMMKFVKFSIVLQMEDGLEMIENLRVLLNQFQFNRKLYQIFMFSLAGGGNMAVDIISSTLEQKFFLRQIKAFDSIRFNTHVSGQASISNKAVEENLECLPSAYLYYIYAMLLYSSRGFLSSLQYLSRIEKQVSDDPMFNLMMGLSYIHRSMQRLTPNRHFQILHGFRYLYQYYDLKANSNDTIDKQEASYNIGRSFHLLGLLTPAVKYYYEVLDSKFKDRRLKKHAAYNLVLIFNESGNTRLSSWLIEHYFYLKNHPLKDNKTKYLHIITGMPRPSQNIPFPIKMKTLLKMSIQRLRYAQEKGESTAKQSRRDVAKLLKNGKETKALFKVETLINDDNHMELLEIMELYCELLHARYQLVGTIRDEIDLIENHMDDGINEAIRAIVFASIHIPEIKEIQQLKELFKFKFGLDFIKSIVDEKVGVPERVINKCCPKLPSEELVELYTIEIARVYDAPYNKMDENKQDEVGTEETGSKEHLKQDNLQKETSNTGSNEASNKESVTPKVSESLKRAIHTKEQKNTQDLELEDLKKRFEALRH